MKLTDCEDMYKEVDYKLQPSCITCTMHEGESAHICGICGKSFTRNNNLTFHIDIVHEGKKPHGCNICGKSFSRKHHLKQHVVTVHEGPI